MVVLVLLPSIAPLLGGTAIEDGSSSATGPAVVLPIALGKAALFAVLMVVGGRRLLPWILELVARQGSRELFTLAVLAGALGIAYLASAVFGVSLALGAFLAGAVIGESDLSHQAAADALPLRDAFAVLFFVSVGMLVDPAYMVAEPLAIVAVVVLIVVAKPVTAYMFMAAFGYPIRTGLTVSAGLGQIGEFSFIVGALALDLGLLTSQGFQLIVAGAIASITINPFLFRAIEPLTEAIAGRPRLAGMLVRGGGEMATLEPEREEGLRGHAILGGYGRVGRMLGTALERRGFQYVVITRGPDRGRAGPGAGPHGTVRRCRERGTAQARRHRACQGGDRGHLRPAGGPPHRHPGSRAQPAGRPGRANPQRHRGGLPAKSRRQCPGDPRRARAGGPDDPLLASTIRRERSRGRGDRPGDPDPSAAHGDRGARAIARADPSDRMPWSASVSAWAAGSARPMDAP